MTAPLIAPGAWQCDWTHWQGAINAIALERAGFDIFNLKVGGAIKGGGEFIDPFFLENFERTYNFTKAQPMAFWYLMPGQGGAQAARFYRQLQLAGGPKGIICELDVEYAPTDTTQPLLKSSDVTEFMDVWNILSEGYPIQLYTRKNYWEQYMRFDPVLITPVVQIAHYVTSQNDPNKMLAFQQYSDVDPAWWSPQLSSAREAYSLQFTGHAYHGGKWIPASAYRYSLDEVQRELVHL